MQAEPSEHIVTNGYPRSFQFITSALSKFGIDTLFYAEVAVLFFDFDVGFFLTRVE